MGVRRVTKKFLKYLIPTLLVLLIIPFTEKRANAPKVFEPVTGGDTLHCAIRLGDFDNLNNGYHTGFHYELLNRFAYSQGDSAEVHLGESRGSYLDSIRTGRLDLIVIPAGRVPAGRRSCAGAGAGIGAEAASPDCSGSSGYGGPGSADLGEIL